MGFGFINGICNTFEDAKKHALYISELAGRVNVGFVYNASQGAVNDFGRCYMGLKGVAREPVRLLHKMWNNFFGSSSSDSRFIMTCHSEGAILVRNALLDYPEDLRKKIIVIAIAPGGYIFPETCDKVSHYRAPFWRDFVPRLDYRGSLMARDTIFDLPSASNAPYFDHEFQSPTYTDMLRENLQYYTKGKI